MYARHATPTFACREGFGAAQRDYQSSLGRHLDLLHEILESTAAAYPDASAVADRLNRVTYAELATMTTSVANGLLSLDIQRGDRVAIWLPNQIEMVSALFGAMRAGGIAVPTNALLKAPQVAHIMRDSGAQVLVTTTARYSELQREAVGLAGLRAVVTVSGPAHAAAGQAAVVAWDQLMDAPSRKGPRCIDSDVAALFYTSGSTGRPKGVILSHRNMVTGARSVAGYLGNTPNDRLLALLSCSFDYGFSQLTTAFTAGASVVLLDYRLPQEVMLTLEREHITGLAAVPPIWIQLADLRWPDAVRTKLRYLTSSGGALPQATLARLRGELPGSRIFLMYGLTEAFRSTYLPPDELDRRPHSIGKAIPGAEVLVLRPDGTECAVDEPGELVHRGALVSLGYWNDPELTKQRFRPIPSVPGELPLPETAVWSGDVVRRDQEGFLYFVGRRDELIKSSGVRISPTEIEVEAYETGLVREAVAIGVPHDRLGQAIALVVAPATGEATDTDQLLGALRRRLPRYMIPLTVEWLDSLPRNTNGKIDRAHLRNELSARFIAATQCSSESSDPAAGVVGPPHRVNRSTSID